MSNLTKENSTEKNRFPAASDPIWGLKRIVGLPGDEIILALGDIYINRQIVRKPVSLQQKLRVPFDCAVPVSFDAFTLFIPQKNRHLFDIEYPLFSAKNLSSISFLTDLPNSSYQFCSFNRLNFCHSFNLLNCINFSRHSSFSDHFSDLAESTDHPLDSVNFSDNDTEEKTVKKSKPPIPAGLRVDNLSPIPVFNGYSLKNTESVRDIGLEFELDLSVFHRNNLPNPEKTLAEFAQTPSWFVVSANSHFKNVQNSSLYSSDQPFLSKENRSKSEPIKKLEPSKSSTLKEGHKNQTELTELWAFFCGRPYRLVFFSTKQGIEFQLSQQNNVLLHSEEELADFLTQADLTSFDTPDSWTLLQQGIFSSSEFVLPQTELSVFKNQLCFENLNITPPNDVSKYINSSLNLLKKEELIKITHEFISNIINMTVFEKTSKNSPIQNPTKKKILVPVCWAFCDQEMILEIGNRQWTNLLTENEQLSDSDAFWRQNLIPTCFAQRNHWPPSSYSSSSTEENSKKTSQKSPKDEEKEENKTSLVKNFRFFRDIHYSSCPQIDRTPFSQSNSQQINSQQNTISEEFFRAVRIYRVPPGHLFLLGDNSILSEDSRKNGGIFVPESAVIGTVAE